MNLLRNEKSPYLLQHADNPVNWMPWGEAAFRKAREEGKPIFLSVGYSTCHWCHVMAHESFENVETARLLNEHFVAVKVDREERPDVDRVYMNFVQATTSQGGWPMSVWLTPGLQPFHGGTYYPPEDRYGRPGFPTLLRRIAELWGSEREAVERQGEQMIRNLASTVSAPSDGDEPGDAELEDGYQAMLARFEARHGGFGGAPKFPRPALLHFLFRYGARKGFASPDGKSARDMALFTLDRMAAGGMRDHLGGGFHRYSVDTYWHVPHFEKMLYDQAQLATAYLAAWQITEEEKHAAVTREILDYVSEKLRSPEGGFLSAEDADSLLRHGSPEHAEGAFYVWSWKELAEVLGGDALGGDTAIFTTHYGVEPEGNAPAESDPHGEFTGQNILIERQTIAVTAAKFGLPEGDVKERLARARALLCERREKRPRPHLDDKVITAWNGLMISAFAQAARALEEPRYLDTAVAAAGFVLNRMYNPETGRLLRSWREGPGPAEGFADDYAFLIAGLLDLFEATFDARWLQQAFLLQQKMDGLFWDKRDGGYFSTTGEDPTILIRAKEDYDGAEPAAGSVAASNLLRFADLTHQPAFREGAKAVFQSAQAMIANAPIAVPQLLASLTDYLTPPLHLAIVGLRDRADTKALLAETARHYLPHRTLLQIEPGKRYPWLGETAAFYEGLPMVEGKATAYLCENLACRQPVTEVEALGALLKSR